MKIPSIELATKEEIAAEQWKLMQNHLRYLQLHSPFYQQHFKKHNIDIAAINSLADIEQIPAIGKKELQKNSPDFWCIPHYKVIDFATTSGTEGESITVPFSDKDLDRLAYNEAISLACAGVGKEDVVQMTTTIDRQFVAGLAYFEGARKLGAGIIRVGPGLPQLQWKMILAHQTTVLIAVPSFLVKLIEFAEAHGIDYKNSSVKRAVCIGEPLRNSDLTLNALGQRITEKWDIQLHSTYASTEMATAFTECNEGCGGHEHPGLIYTELLDDKGNSVPEGAAGELTITTFGLESMPLLRFRTGDICVKHTEKCVCGRNTTRLGPIIGRKNQMIKFKGTTCFPPALFDVLDHTPEVSAYQVEVYANEFGNDELLVRYAAKEKVDQHFLINRFKATIRVSPKLELVSPDTLNKLIFPEGKRKAVKFVDSR